MTHRAGDSSPWPGESRNHVSSWSRGVQEPASNSSEASSIPANERGRAPEEGIAATSRGRRLPGVQRFNDAFARLLGKQVIVADPESLEETLVGHQIVKSVYHATVSYCAEDCLALARPFVHKRGTTESKETVEQLIPLSKIKRMTLMKGQVVLHL